MKPLLRHPAQVREFLIQLAASSDPVLQAHVRGFLFGRCSVCNVDSHVAGTLPAPEATGGDAAAGEASEAASSGTRVDQTMVMCLRSAKATFRGCRIKQVCLVVWVEYHTMTEWSDSRAHCIHPYACRSARAPAWLNF